MGIASLVLGILAIVIGLFSAGSLGWLGAMGRKDPQSAGIATGGLVCSIIGLIFCVILYIACAACIGGLAALS